MDSGTSMATPAVAGTAILVRQFFTDGLHATYAPAGFSHSAYDASSPSAALLKAVLVSSTTPVEFGYTFGRHGPKNLTEFYADSSCCFDAGGAVDAAGDGCAAYTAWPHLCLVNDGRSFLGWAGENDDDDFTAADMCCACGGGVDATGGSVVCRDNPAYADPVSGDACWAFSQLGCDSPLLSPAQRDELARECPLACGACPTAVDQCWYPNTLGAPGVDYHQGFGFVRTSNVLPLGGEFELFVFDRVALGDGETWSRSLDVATAGFDGLDGLAEVDVTLVWTDPPASADCVACLVHDLDLVVTYDGARVYSNFGAAARGDFAARPDEDNNVEKVTIRAPRDGALPGRGLRRRAAALAAADTQLFALVIAGRSLCTTARADQGADVDRAAR